MPISTQIVLQPPTKNSQLSLIGNLMDSSRKKVSEAVEYASGASIYSPEDMIPELTTAQTSVLTLFYGLLFGDLNLCKAVLEIQVPQLKSTFLRTWLADDFSFRHHDVSKVLFLLSYLVDRKILSIPENILRIFGGLFEKYGLAESCPKEMLHVFNVGQKQRNESCLPTENTDSLKLKWYQRRNRSRTKNVEDEAILIVKKEDCIDEENTCQDYSLFGEENKNTSPCSEHFKDVDRDRKKTSEHFNPKDHSAETALQKYYVIDSQGRTLLHRLAQFGRTEAVGRLLVEGVDPDVRDDSGKTALHWAVEYDQCSTVELLLKSGADVNARTKIGKTPLSFAYFENGTMSKTWKTIVLHGGTI